MSKYYYKHKNGSLKEHCKFVKSQSKLNFGKYVICIGSASCFECEHNLGISDKERYVICKKYNNREDKLKRIINE